MLRSFLSAHSLVTLRHRIKHTLAIMSRTVQKEQQQNRSH